MKSRHMRFVSFIIAIVLILTAFPFSASAATFNQIVNAATEIIVINEGNYTTVVRNDNGSLSLGKICWHGTNALNLLKKIVAANPSQAQNILGSALYNEIITSYSWDRRIPSSAEAAVLSVFLSTAESKAIQDESAWEFISDYVTLGMSLGITEPEALVFFADYANQNGKNGAASFYYQVRNAYGNVNLGTLYSASSHNSRRTRTYNFCATVNWSAYSDSSVLEKDNQAPQITDVVVSDITSDGYTVSCTASDNTAVTAIYFAVFYKDDGADNVKWYKQETTATASMTVDISEFGSRAGYYCTFIYAFDAAGNYVYVELNPVNVPAPEVQAPVLSLTVSAETDGKNGGYIKWRAAASGGSGSYIYAFSVYKDGVLVEKRNYNDFSDYEYSVQSTGSYAVMVSVYDNITGKIASAVSTSTDIFEPIVINSFRSNIPAAILGQSVFWTVDATGGEGDLSYSYTLYRDDEIVYSTDFVADNYKFQYKPDESGVYNVTAYIRDSRSQVISVKSDDITVIRPLSAENVEFSSDYAAIGKKITCSAEILGGTGDFTAKFSIYCNGELVLESDDISAGEFTFTVQKSGNYTASVVVTDADSTVTDASGGSLKAVEKAEKGDANCDGKVNAADARYALRCAAGLEITEEALIYAADINGDGKITAYDSRAILRHVSRLETF